MPLQKTGSHFKQAVFHRESNSADGFFEYDRDTSNRQPENLFWISENPKSDKPVVRRNTAIMVRKQPQTWYDSDETAQLPSSLPLSFEWDFNDKSPSGSVSVSGDGVGGSVGDHGSASTPNLIKAESDPIGNDIGSLSKSKSKSKSKSCVLLAMGPTSINDNNQHHNHNHNNRQPRYHYFPQTLAPPKVDSGDAQTATQAQTCRIPVVFSEKENPQHLLQASNLRLHSSTREAQATSSDKLMEVEGSTINLFHNPNTRNSSPLLDYLINDKGISPTLVPTGTATQKPKLIRSTKSNDRFNFISKDKSFLPFHSHKKSSISTSASCSNLKTMNMVESTDNVDQLIRETDEAFQAVGFALGDAKAATQGWQRMDRRSMNGSMSTNIINNTKNPNININISTRQNRSFGNNKSIARTNSISKRNQMQNSNILKERPSSPSGPSGKSPVPKSIIASKAKKSNSPKQKKNIGSNKVSRKSLPHPHSSARWNLGDVTASMADVFKGKFTRLEADEMLTPDRLQQLEEKAEKAKLDNERKASLENAHIEAARNAEIVKDAEGISPMEKSHKIDGNKTLDTDIVSPASLTMISPTEPFHLESLLPRINNDKTSNSPQVSGSASPLPPTPADMAEYSERDHKIARKPLPEVPNPDYAEIDAIEQAFEHLNFPSPPRDSAPRLPRSRSNTGITSLLPTIPEISPLNVLSPRTPKRSISLDSEYSQDSSASSVDYIELPSTPYTLTSPLFRHGPIRLEHVYHSRRDSLAAPDLEEALDWTAFQMAISGTMDDGTLGASEESIWEADEAEVDGILDWWTGFGYAGIGRLVKEASPSRRKRGKSLAAADAEKSSPRKYKENRDNRVTTIGLGLGLAGSRGSRPKTPEYKGGLWVETIHDSAPQVVEPTWGERLGARRDVVLKVNVPEPEIDDDDNDSLPPSPINLVKIKDEYIPMGYNLGHDLGDFLNWETYHVQSLFGEDEGRTYM